MFHRLSVALTLVLIISVSGIGRGSIRAHAAEDFASGAEGFIQQMAEDAIRSLTAGDLAKVERQARFRDMMLRFIAFKGVARWVIGRKVWRAASEDQQNKYLGLFEDLMVVSYAHYFEDYSGETLAIKRTDVYDGRDALVSTDMLRPGGTKPLAIGWRVRAKDGEYRVVDIMVEGLSLARKQRSEFSSFLRQHDDDFEALISEISKRVEGARQAFTK